MAIQIAPGQQDPQPPVQPATTQQIESQVFQIVSVTAGREADYSVDDLVERTIIYDGATVVGTVWTNLTTNTVIATAPEPADLAAKSVSGLTDAELRASAVDVFVVNPTEAADLAPGADTTTYSEQFEALADDTISSPTPQWSEGDVITREAVVDESTTPATITYTYFNETTGLPIDTTGAEFAPTQQIPTSELTQIVQQGLTDAELRANPIDVYVTNQPAPGPLPTENQSFVNQYEALTTDPNGQWTAGDTLVYEAVYDYSTDPATLVPGTEQWFNQTTGEVINNVAPNTYPAASDITATPQNVVAPAIVRNIVAARASGDAAFAIAEGATQIDIYCESGYITMQGQIYTAGYSFSWVINNPGEVLGALPIDTANGTLLYSVAR